MPFNLTNRRFVPGQYNVFDFGHTVVIPQEKDPAPPVVIPMPAYLPGPAMIGGPLGGYRPTGAAMQMWLQEDMMLPDDIAQIAGELDYSEQPISRPFPKLAPTIQRPGDWQ